MRIESVVGRDARGPVMFQAQVKRVGNVVLKMEEVTAAVSARCVTAAGIRAVV